MQIIVKRIVFILILGSVLSSCSLFKCNNFVPMEERYPKKVYELDVKTKLIDKYNETGIKYGTIAYLNNKPWSKVVELGENYSVWIKDLVRNEKEAPIITVEFTLELQEPALALEGKTFKKKKFTITYEADSALIKVKADSEAQLVGEYFKRYAERAKEAGKISAYVNNMFIKKSPIPYSAVCAFVIDWMSKNLQDDKMWKYKRLEAVICGSEVCGTLGEWLWEIENEKPGN